MEGKEALPAQTLPSTLLSSSPPAAVLLFRTKLTIRILKPKGCIRIAPQELLTTQALPVLAEPSACQH